MAKQIKQGDRWFQTRNTELAAILSALDFGFWDDENACDLREIEGDKKVMWMFAPMSKNGDSSAEDVYRAWKNADKYCEENPKCRIGSAVAAVKNLRVFKDGVKNGVPLVGYKLGRHTMWVLKDSEKDKKLQGTSRAKRI